MFIVVTKHPGTYITRTHYNRCCDQYVVTKVILPSHDAPLHNPFCLVGNLATYWGTSPWCQKYQLKISWHHHVSDIVTGFVAASHIADVLTHNCLAISTTHQAITVVTFNFRHCISAQPFPCSQFPFFFLHQKCVQLYICTQLSLSPFFGSEHANIFASFHHSSNQIHTASSLLTTDHGDLM